MTMMRMVMMDMGSLPSISGSGLRTPCSLHPPYPSDTELETPRVERGGRRPLPPRFVGPGFRPASHGKAPLFVQSDTEALLPQPAAVGYSFGGVDGSFSGDTMGTFKRTIGESL